MKKSIKYLKIFVNLVYVIALICIFTFAVPKMLGFFAPFVVGFILSLIANPIVRFLEKRINIKRKYGSVIMILSVVGVIVLVCYGLILALVGGFREFMDYMPTLYNDAGVELTKAAQHLQNIINKLPLKNDVDFTSLGETLGAWATEVIASLEVTSVSAVGDVAKSLPNILVGIIVGVLATYFFIADHDKLSQSMHKYFPMLFSGNSLLVYRELFAQLHYLSCNLFF